MIKINSIFQKLKNYGWAGVLLTLCLSISIITVSTKQSWAAEGFPIPAGASDSYTCAVIEQTHIRAIDIWRANDLTGSLELLKSCESALKKRGLWMPAKLPEKPTADQVRALKITNNVIFSLAAIYQRLGRRADSERYADEARKRGLLPKVFMAGQKRR